MQLMNRLTTTTLLAAMLGASAVLPLTSCETAPKTEPERAALGEQVNATISRFKATDPTMEGRFDTAYGYVVFPSIAKGAVGVGGAHGQGQVFEQGRLVGYADLTQATVGLQLGGQTYSQVIFFQNREALNRLKAGTLEFAAQASAVAATAGASANHDYTNGVLVFTMAEGGLMFEASIGGQTFGYVPIGAFDN